MKITKGVAGDRGMDNRASRTSSEHLFSARIFLRSRNAEFHRQTLHVQLIFINRDIGINACMNIRVRHAQVYRVLPENRMAEF